jgi:hypothetical protein
MALESKRARKAEQSAKAEQPEALLDLPEPQAAAQVAGGHEESAAAAQRSARVRQKPVAAGGKAKAAADGPTRALEWQLQAQVDV